MLISINRKPLDQPWGGGNMFVKILTKALRERGHQVCFDLPPDVDVIVMIDPRHDSQGYSAEHIYQYLRAYPTTRVMHRVNECDKRKGGTGMDDLLTRANEVLVRRPGGQTVFISEWLRDYFESQDWPEGSPAVYNGCDINLFSPRTGDRAPGPLRLVTHHWSDNWLKGFDLYAEIDKYLENHDDFEFTYVGRYCKEYTSMNTNLVDPLSGEPLAAELRKHDIYVTASRWEPCGMHHIEGAASGLPVLYHTDGGGIVEGCVDHGLPFTTFQEFLEQMAIMKKSIESYRSKINYDFLSSQRVTQEYVDIIERMI